VLPKEDISAAYLTALKRSDDGRSASAVAGPCEMASQITSAVGQPEFQGPEKRRTSRYRCDGSVEMSEQGSDVRTSAVFTDISLHGCYVEAKATYPAGTVLQMTLEADGIRMETAGEVRVNYPYMGMGISFREMSQENVTRLRELLGVVSQPESNAGQGIAAALASTAPQDGIPVVKDPAQALRLLTTFFESRQTLPREDFILLLRESQTGAH
jgi:hypothetical protein